MSTASNPGQAPSPTAPAGEAVHDRVPPVGEHDQQHADVVARRAPQRLDRVHGRAVAEHGDDGPVGQPHAQSDRPGQPEARGSRWRCSGTRTGSSPEDAGRARAGSTDTPRRGGRRQEAARRARRARDRAGGALRHPARQRRRSADGLGRIARRARATARRARGRWPRRAPTTARSQGLRCASAGSAVSDRDARVRTHERYRLVEQVRPERVRPHASGRRRSGSSASCMSRRCQCRWPANSGWSCGKETRRLNGSCHTGQRRRSASATTPSQSSLVGRARRPAPGTRRRRGDPRALRRPPRPHRVRAEQPCRRAGGELVGGLEPVAHRHDQQRRTPPGPGLVVGARDRARNVLAAGREMAPHRILAGQPLELPSGQERLERRSAGGPAVRPGSRAAHGSRARWRSR